MEEKKLTDEEIINALDKTKQELANISPEDDDYDKLLTVKTIVDYCHDFIHRLKDENESIKKDYIELDLECRELRTEVDTKQCIITLLAKDVDERDKQLKSKVEEVYADFMKDYKIMREELNGVYDELGEEIFAHEEFTKKANEEIERLTEEHKKDTMLLYASGLACEQVKAENAELQKQVDELTAFKNEAISMSLYGKGRKDGEAVAVKDTAKEILGFVHISFFRVDVENWIKEKYGVEVE